MNTKATLELAIMLAVQHHTGQVDKSGEPYILHVLRVGLAGKNLKEQIVGFLHDTVEDTTLTLNDLAQWFDAEILLAVHAITRQKGEPYPAFIRRAGSNAIARPVKINDLNDNLVRAQNLPLAQRHGLERRYNRALLELERTK